jgi:hypothetical protein
MLGEFTGLSPFCKAIVQGDEQQTLLLIRAGQDVNERTTCCGESLLEQPVVSIKEATVKRQHHETSFWF